MTPEQAAAFVFSQAVCAMAEIESMKRANEDHQASFVNREGSKPPPPYSADDFRAVPERFGIHSNAVLGLFQSVSR